MNLSELINKVKDEEGLTFRQLTDRAREKGAPVPTGIYYMAKRPIEDFPKTKTIRGLVAALEVAPEVIAAAALESLGLTPSNVVELRAKNLRVHPGGADGDEEGYPGEPVIAIVPADDTTEDLLQACQSATNLRVILPSDDRPAARNSSR